MSGDASISKKRSRDSSKHSSPSKHTKSKGKERVEDVEEAMNIKSSKKHKTGQSTTAADLEAESSDFKAIRAVMKLPLAPVFSDDVVEGARQSLESWIMRYIPSIDAVLLSVTWPPEFLETNAPLVNSSAFGVVKVRWEGVGFRPQIGSTSTGKLSLATPSVISILLHNLFNASISADHIPKDKYEWDAEAKLPYSLAPHGITRASRSGLAKDAQKLEGQEDVDEPGAEDAAEDAAEDGEEELEDNVERGCWVDKETREPLGGLDGTITFKVIGLTVANSMISVHGSLLEDPIPAIQKAEKKSQKTVKK